MTKEITSITGQRDKHCYTFIWCRTWARKWGKQNKLNITCFSVGTTFTWCWWANTIILWWNGLCWLMCECWCPYVYVFLSSENHLRITVWNSMCLSQSQVWLSGRWGSKISSVSQTRHHDYYSGQRYQ